MEDNGYDLFNINSNKKFYFGDLKLELPIDYEKSNFETLNKIFKEIKNEPYQ